MSVVVTEPITEGAVLLRTSLGEIKIELWAREAPKAVRNFVQLCLEGYYDGSPFHRVVPNFIAQTGDPSGTGQGGESIYDDGEFADEFNQRLKFNRRGLVAMANQGKRNTNLSQFFFTLDRTDELQNRNTIFGRVAGDTLFNVLKLNEIELEPGSERPVYPPTIKSIEVLDNPFDDIVPRITAKERKEQDKAKREMKLEKAKQKEQGKRKGTKNVGLLSFGDEPEEGDVVGVKKTKFMSSHDVLDDPRLSKEVKDDRGTSVNLPPEMMENFGPPPKPSSGKSGERSAPAPSTSKAKVELIRETKKSESTSQSDKVKADIAKVQADLKRMTRGSDSESDDEEGEKKPKKVKRTGPSLLQLEREKYTKGAASKSSKGKKVRREDPDLMDALGEFSSKLREAKENPVEAPVVESVDFDAEDEDDEDINGSGWLSHKLIFRKDATLDRHTIDEYAVVDPLNKSSMTLDEINYKAGNSARRYPGEREERGDRRGGGGGGGDRRGGGGDRDRRGGGGGGGGSRHRDDYRSGGGDRSRDNRGGGGGGHGGRSSDQYDRGSRPEVQGSSWKDSRVSRDDLA